MAPSVYDSIMAGAGPYSLCSINDSDVKTVSKSMKMVTVLQLLVF
jgi:hypothetical protein